MDDQSMNQSVCLFQVNGNLSYFEAKLNLHFKLFTAVSEVELQMLLTNHAIFCVVLEGHIIEPDDLSHIRQICRATPQIPHIVTGKITDPSLLFELPNTGVTDFVPHAETARLIEKLNELKMQATFRVDLTEFGIYLNNCTNLWVRRFLDFILADQNYLKIKSVTTIAAHLGVTVEHLCRNLKDESGFSPKQLLLCLQSYYAAYLLKTTSWSVTRIAALCGFSIERAFYRCFKNQTGKTVSSFRRDHDWRNYPFIYLMNLIKKD